MDKFETWSPSGREGEDLEEAGEGGGGGVLKATHFNPEENKQQKCTKTHCLAQNMTVAFLYICIFLKHHSICEMIKLLLGSNRTWWGPACFMIKTAFQAVFSLAALMNRMLVRPAVAKAPVFAGPQIPPQGGCSASGRSAQDFSRAYVTELGGPLQRETLKPTTEARGCSRTFSDYTNSRKRRTVGRQCGKR